MNLAAIRPSPPVRTLVALCVLNHVALSGARAALALQALRLGVPSVGLALMLAPFALASTLAALPLGRGIDRVGARVPALAGMALMAGALAAAAWQPAIAWMTAAAGAIGLGYTASLIALQSELARERTASERAAAFSGFAIGTAASGGLGPFLAGQFMARFGAHWAFGALAIVSLVAASGGAWNARRLLQGSAPAAPSRGLSLKGLGGLRRLMLADLLMAFAWNANGFAVPLVGQREGWTADTVGNLLGCFGLAVMLVRALPGGSRVRAGGWRAIAHALLAGGAALALLPLLTAMPLPYVLEGVFGCGLGSSLPSVLALLEQHTPPGRRAEVLGLRQGVLGLGAVTLPTALGALMSAAGLVWALLGFGGALVAAGATIAPRVSARTPASARRSPSPAGRRPPDGARRCPR
jgi:MFS family permease